jgi:hypothetical protein
MLDRGFFDNEEWGDITSITIRQLENTKIEGNDTAAVIIGCIGLGLGFISGAVGNIVGVLVALGSIASSLASIPDGVYNTFEITITGTTIIESCGVKSIVQYEYHSTFLYSPNGNNSEPSLYILNEVFTIL